MEDRISTAADATIDDAIKCVVPKRKRGRPKRDRLADQVHLVRFCLYKQQKSEWEDRSFHLSAENLKTHYGKQYKTHVITPLKKLGVLQVLDNESYTVGRDTKRYALLTTEPFKQALEASLPPEYKALRDRTNLHVFGPGRYKDGKDGDHRFYTDYTAAKGNTKDLITIDEEATVEFDASNLWPYLLGKHIKADRHYLGICEAGLLYDHVRDIANGRTWSDIESELADIDGFDHCWYAQNFVTREDAKTAVAKIMNDPKPKMRFVRYHTALDGKWYCEKTRQNYRVQLAVMAFEIEFPGVYKRFRELAQARTSYFLGSKEEKALRDSILEKCESAGIDVVLSSHDSFRMKESHAPIFEHIISKLPVHFKRKKKKSY